jgi:hypothetical protein
LVLKLGRSSGIINPDDKIIIMATIDKVDCRIENMYKRTLVDEKLQIKLEF